MTGTIRRTGRVDASWLRLALGLAAAIAATGFTAAPVSPEAQAAIQGVLNSGKHPWLTWPDVTLGLADLKTLYAAESGGLFWFDGEKPRPALEPALQAIARCDEVGLVPSDYDAAKLLQKWAAMKTAGAATSPADRALFDMAVTVSAARLLQAVHWGRVDPRLVGFNYDVS